jgi:hypothetical protein
MQTFSVFAMLKVTAAIRLQPQPHTPVLACTQPAAEECHCTRRSPASHCPRLTGRYRRGRHNTIVAVTGPVMLHNSVDAYRATGGRGLTILGPGVIYPIDWRKTLMGP